MKTFGEVAFSKTPFAQRILVMQDDEHGYAHIEKVGDNYFIKGYDSGVGFYMPLTAGEVAREFAAMDKEFRQ